MPPHPHCHWRGIKEFRDLGLPVSTSSDDACKMFDATLTQLVSYYDDQTVGGVRGTIEKMLVADPDFVLGNAIKLSYDQRTTEKSNDFAIEIYKMKKNANKDHVSAWERKHAEAVALQAEGKLEAASNVWEDILLEHPLDMFALNATQRMYARLGYPVQRRDSVARVLPYWKKENPYYGDVLSLYSLGLEETNFFPEAQSYAEKALSINKNDAWASHTIAHVNEARGRTKLGVQHMKTTEDSWKDGFLGCHHYWHWSLYYMEDGNFEEAKGILQQELVPRMKFSKSAFNMTDAAALAYRLELEGCSASECWDDIFDVSKDHLFDHDWAFNDVCTFIGCLGAKKSDCVEDMLLDVKKYAKHGSRDIHRVYEHFLVPVLEAFQSFDAGNFDKAVEFMFPVRYNFLAMGGSDAQRDLLNQFLIHAAMKSDEKRHRNLAKSLLLERKQFKDESPMVERLLQHLETHGHNHG